MGIEKSLSGLRFLVTAGPTREALDPVRFISNHSTGKMGYAVATELVSRGADVVLVSGPVCLPAPEKVERICVVSAGEMYRKCVDLWPEMDGAVMCAAVADYTPVKVSATKIKKDLGLTLELRPTPDIAAELGRTKRKGQILVGFALETDNEESNALSKLERKNLDLIVLNSLRDEGAGFGGDTNRITIFSRSRKADSPDSHSRMTGGDNTRSIQAGNASCGPARIEFPLETKLSAAAHIVDLIESL